MSLHVTVAAIAATARRIQAVRDAAIFVTKNIYWLVLRQGLGRSNTPFALKRHGKSNMFVLPSAGSNYE
jgi:hypothetical protein